MRTVDYTQLEGLRGESLGHTDWMVIDQQRIDRFAAATDDDQWIHVDVERATRENGSTIAHGFLILSLLPKAMYSLLSVTGTRHMLNIGTNRIRFAASVPAGSRIRLHLSVLDVTPRAGGQQVILEGRFEIEGVEKPACVVESVMLYLPLEDRAAA